MSAAGAGLAGLFEPPRGIMFQGSFEEAKSAALEKSQWLVRLCTRSVKCTSVRMPSMPSWRSVAPSVLPQPSQPFGHDFTNKR